jgi:hypothetical protein
MTPEERKVKQKEWSAKWRANNKEKHKEHCAKWRANNREQDLANKAKYRAENKEKIAEGYRRHVLQKEYGLSKEDYDRMLEEQGGICAICKKPCATKRSLAVDHDHVSGKIRGLLCRACNVVLGLMKDNPALLRISADYLELHALNDKCETTKTT